MVDIFDETSDIALDTDKIPTVKVGTAGLASASQLVDTTSKTEITTDSTADYYLT